MLIVINVLKIRDGQKNFQLMRRYCSIVPLFGVLLVNMHCTNFSDSFHSNLIPSHKMLLKRSSINTKNYNHQVMIFTPDSTTACPIEFDNC